MLRLERVGQPVELLKSGIGVMCAVLGMTGNLDHDGVLSHVPAVVGAERDPGYPGAQEGAACLVLAPARQFVLGEQPLILRRLGGPDVNDNDVQFMPNCQGGSPP